MKRLFFLVLPGVVSAVHAVPIRVTVWDQQNPAPKKTHPNHLGNQPA